MRLSVFYALTALALACPAIAADKPPRVISFVGDSTSSPLYTPPGFPALVGQILTVPIHNMVVKSPPSYSMDDALTEELPQLPEDTTDVVLWLGLDDLRSIAAGDRSVEAVERTNDRIITILRARRIRIYELTIRDYTHEPAFRPQLYDKPAILARIPAIVDALNAHYKRTRGITVIDVQRWDDVFGGEWSGDGMHISLARLPVFAKDLAAALAVQP